MASEQQSKTKSTQSKSTSQAKSTAKKPQDKKAPTPSKTAPIEVTADRNTIPIKLVGKTYEVKPPKTFTSLRLGKTLQNLGDDQDPDEMIEALESWIRSIFSEDDADAVMYRLNEDDQDDLDIMHIVQLMNRLMEQTTGNPTT